MKWLKYIALSGATIAATGIGVSLALEAPPVDPEVVELLSGMTYVPDQSSIDSVFGESAVLDLISIAEDTSAQSDPGLRLRAFAALGQYRNSPDEAAAHDALRRALAKFSPRNRGTEVLYLRASLVSLAQLERENAVSDLVPILSHPIRDVRATCARAVGLTLSEDAILPLRQRAQVEEEEQVQLAIEEALFVLASSE